MNKSKLIVFDIDGTLTDSVTIHQTAFIQALRQMGVQEMDTHFKDYKHHTDSYIAKTIYENDTHLIFSEVELNQFESYLMEGMASIPIQEIPGARKLIHDLEIHSEYHVCYATGSLWQAAKYKLDSIGISYSDAVLVASNNLQGRADIVRQAIQKASEFYGIQAFESIISVGDGLWDLKTAKQLDIEFIGIGKKHKKILSEHGMKHHYDDLTTFNIFQLYS